MGSTRDERRNSTAIRGTRNGVLGRKARRRGRVRDRSRDDRLTDRAIELPLLLSTTMASMVLPPRSERGRSFDSERAPRPTFRADSPGYRCCRRFAFTYTTATRVDFSDCGVHSPKYPPMVVATTTASIARQIMIMIFFCARHQWIGKNTMIDYKGCSLDSLSLPYLRSFPPHATLNRASCLSWLPLANLFPLESIF